MLCLSRIYLIRLCLIIYKRLQPFKIEPTEAEPQSDNDS